MKLPYIEAGEIVTTHGVRGEVKVLSWLDSPEMLCEFDRCRISGREYVSRNERENDDFVYCRTFVEIGRV